VVRARNVNRDHRFCRLTIEQVSCIARAGGIDFKTRSEEARQFEASLDFLRREYEEEVKMKKLSLKDSQIAERLTKARHFARELRKLFSEEAFDYQFFRLIEDESPWTPLLGLPPLDPLIARVELALKKLKVRSPDDRWAQPEGKENLKAGRRNLLLGLMYLWQIETKTIKPLAGRTSLLVRFLQQGHSEIVGENVGIDTADQWARKLLPRALKRLDIGHFLFRPVNDPEAMEHLCKLEPGYHKVLF